jgi:hypothetical protein
MTATGVTSAPRRFLVAGAVGLALVMAGCTTGTDVTTGATPSRSVPATSSAGASTSSPTSSTTGASVVSDPVDAAFRKKVDAMCGGWLQYATNHQYPYENANPDVATAAQLPTIAAYLESVPMNLETVAKATALGAPAQGGGAWAAVVKDMDRYQVAVAAAIASAKTGDVTAWKKSAAMWEAAREAVRADLSVAGVSGPQNSCQFLFSRSTTMG